MAWRGFKNGNDYVPSRPSLGVSPSDLPTFRWPKAKGRVIVGNPGPGKSLRVSGKGWVQFAGVHSGWAFADNPDDNKGVIVTAREFFPAPSLQRIYVVTEGTGYVLVREWDEESGAILAAGGVAGGSQGQQASEIVTTTEGIKSTDGVEPFTPSPGSLGVTIVNRGLLSDGITPNTHNLAVSSDPAVLANGLGGTLLSPGQAYSFPGGQTFYFIPDGIGPVVDMVAEFNESF